MLSAEAKIALATLADDIDGITVREAYWHLYYMGWRQPGLGHIEVFLNCFPRGTTLKKALIHES